jgi:4-oxalocrotonate tautomerase
MLKALLVRTEESLVPKEEGMPHVEITWVAGRTAEQKRKIAERVTAVLIEDGKAKRENIHVTFHDLPATDYAEAGVLVADQKRAP